MTMIKVMLADDHVLVREGIRHLLEFDKSMEVIAEVKDGVECLKKLESEKPDILLLDLSMPNMSGIHVLKELKKIKNPVKVLILTVHNEAEFIISAMDSGANGYILKESGLEELKYAIRIVLNNETYIQPSLLPILDKKIVNKNVDKEKIESLTKRELEILIQLAGGMFNKEIANNLNISERTVKNHISNIFRKINVSDRTQAAVFAIKNNIVKIWEYFDDVSRETYLFK